MTPSSATVEPRLGASEITIENRGYKEEHKKMFLGPSDNVACRINNEDRI